MPSNVIAKTKSALKRREVITLLLAAVVFATAVFGLKYNATRTRTLEVGGHSYRLEVAISKAQHEKGLSDRKSLAENHGMLFLFQREDKECFWMKDMEFPLDIIWVDGAKKVVHLERNVSPDTYPQAICPSEKATYVIELNAGQAAEAGILPGQVLNF